MMRIATRKSLLALWQSEHAAGLLRQHHPDLDVELVPLSTRGDEVLDRSLSEIGGKGVFLKELERAMLDDEADIAVHSLKDVPAESPPEFELVASLPGGDWGDWWITCNGAAPADLPPGSRVGTSSLRRQSQLLAAHPDLEIVPVRGNVQTRLDKLDRGDVDALILAAAGLRRLEIEREHWQLLKPPAFLPAPGQGVIVVQCRRGDERVRRLIEPLNCQVTAARVRAERAVVHELGGDCRMPLAALAEVNGSSIRLQARLASPDGRQVIDASGEGAVADADRLGREAAHHLLDRGGREILAALD
ncbi:hydroxymethylbilane synthase [Wenzhouxiangella sp. AB-CW3]|uniref:hydroxymethylbilane synthase n=1 Tax=Wenzhouxiangella sp. AB-CW3 TaxID=2771012 RepID=UPI00168A64B3|nr:hydroxymethylbilane synthase [Wenzhouxiangella sp. AB-CW3]QOC23651.1 hydroxymethylbilane synthase [Wenzhouxiangella sp. AB-CW3]